jgi:hypothetical protein
LPASRMSGPRTATGNEPRHEGMARGESNLSAQMLPLILMKVDKTIKVRNPLSQINTETRICFTILLLACQTSKHGLRLLTDYS